MSASGRASGELLRQVHRLFCLGTVVGLTDGQLLERFIRRSGSESEAAFEELMHRHGPMVLHVCRGMLDDPLSVEDAFQATFLVLAERARSVRRRDSVSSWLFGVARRVAAHARLRAARRRRGERTVAELTRESYLAQERGDESEDFLDEIERLPERHRGVVVLCDLEGLTYETAARRLGLTEGAVRGRLARAREQLRRRLIRRGVVVPASFLVAGAMGRVGVAQPPHVTGALVDSTIRIVFGFRASTMAAAIAQGVVRSMLMSHLGVLAAILVSVGTTLLTWQSLTAGEDRGSRPPVDSDAHGNPSRDEAASTRDAGRSTSKNRPFVVKVEVRDLATGATMDGVHVDCSCQGEAECTATTDPGGIAQLTIPDLFRASSLTVRASRLGFVPLVMTWRRSARSPAPPDVVQFAMETASSIGGRVLDDVQRPVAGATVVINVKKRYSHSEQKPDIAFERTLTDAEGRWVFSNVPERPDAIDVGTYHPLCLTERSFFEVEDFQPLSALRDRSAVLRLRRGTRIEGTVVDPNGRPVPDASVQYGPEDSKAVNGIPPVQTDARGRFTLGVAPGAISVLTARDVAFGPAMQRIRVGSEPQRITLRLQPPRSLVGRVVDLVGKPIANAKIMVQSWRGSESLAQELTTDSQGRFLWEGAPEDEVRVGLYAKGYVRKGNVPLVAGAPNRIVVEPTTVIRGRVVDAETDQPIPRYSLVHGTVEKEGERLLWHRSPRLDDEALKAPGSFECTIGEQAYRLVLRVEAEGYLPVESERIHPDGSLREFTFRLRKADPIRGVVLNPDGSAVRDGVVYAIPAGDQLMLRNGDVDENQRRGAIHAKTSAGGRFSLPPQTEGFEILALAEAGFAAVRQADLPADRVLRLQPWARIKGEARSGTRHAANLVLNALRKGPDSPPKEEDPIVLGHPGGCDVVNYTFRTGDDGRFELSRVMPGHYTFQRVAPNEVRRVWPITLAELDVEAGRSYDLSIGGRGRPVTGRILIPPDTPWMVRKAVIENRVPARETNAFGLQVSTDGHFRADDIPPGDYRLHIAIHEPPPYDRGGWGRLIAEFSGEFTVAPVPGGVSDEPLRLGDLKPQPDNIHQLRVGDPAPDFTVKTLTGKQWRLADLAGKVVLLDLWATWSASCVADRPKIKAIHDRFARDPRFALLSLSVDEDPDVFVSRIRSQHFPWPQAYIGPGSPVANAYGAARLPAMFLIGPDGRIVASDLSGEDARPAVEAALRRGHAAP